MKIGLTLLALGSLIGASNAALYTLNNGTSASTAAGIQTVAGHTFRSGTTPGQAFTGDNAGTSAGPGIVGFGVFSTDDLSNVAAGELASLFTAFGTPGTFGGAATGGNRSVFSSAQSTTITGSEFANKNIYLFVGNGTTYANSTEFLVVKMNTELFLPGDDQANATTPKSITINPANSTVLWGSVVGDVRTTNSDATATEGWQMAVPEPSAALLGLLGAVGLIRRRR